MYTNLSRASICKVRRGRMGGDMEKVRVHVRVEQWGEWSRSEWQRLFTAECRRCSGMWTTCQKWHKTCSLCRCAQNDGLVRLSSRLLLPWPRMTRPHTRLTSRAPMLFRNVCKCPTRLQNKQQQQQEPINKNNQSKIAGKTQMNHRQNHHLLLHFIFCIKTV